MSSKLSQEQAPESGSVADALPGWYVAYTQPKREELALRNFEQQGFEAYLPRYKIFKKSPAGLQVACEPMFPRYVFFRPRQACQSIASARSTRGVSFVLSLGFNPAVLKIEEMDLIRSCEAERESTDFGTISPFQPGRQVRLRGAALSGLEGLVQSVSSKRVTLLLELLGRQKMVHVGHDQLELA